MDNLPSNDNESNDSGDDLDGVRVLLDCALRALDARLRAAACVAAADAGGGFRAALASAASRGAAARVNDLDAAVAFYARPLIDGSGDPKGFDPGLRIALLWLTREAERFAASAARSAGIATADEALCPEGDEGLAEGAREMIEVSRELSGNLRDGAADDDEPDPPTHEAERRAQRAWLDRVATVADRLDDVGDRARLVLLHVATVAGWVRGEAAASLVCDVLPKLLVGDMDGAAMVRRAAAALGHDPDAFGSADRKADSRAMLAAKFYAADNAARRRMVRAVLKVGVSDSAARAKLKGRGVASNVAGRWGITAAEVRALYPDESAATEGTKPKRTARR